MTYYIVQNYVRLRDKLVSEQGKLEDSVKLLKEDGLRLFQRSRTRRETPIPLPVSVILESTEQAYKEKTDELARMDVVFEKLAVLIERNEE